MQLLPLLTLLALLPFAQIAAWPAPSDAVYPPTLQDDSLLVAFNYKYIGDGSDQSRSPCPFLNTAANHGILPYSGLGIKFTWIHRLLLKAGLGDSGANLLVGAAERHVKWYKENRDPDHPDDSINLGDLAAHGQIEHDLSLSRLDILTEQEQPNDWRPNQSLIKSFLANAKLFSGEASDEPTLTYATVSEWRRQRYTDESKRHTPSYGLKQTFLGSGECSLLLNVLGEDGAISGDYAYSFLAKERFPDGWKAHAVASSKLFAGIARCATGYYTSDSVLKWLAPKELPPTKAPQVVENRAMRSWHWAFGNTDACPECVE